MNREFFAATLNRKPELLRAMLAFNGLLVSPPLPDALVGFPRANILWEQAAVRRRFGVLRAADPDFWNFEEEAFRLAFLDAATLERLVITFGVAVMAPELCRLVRRDEVRSARKRLGDALFDYALHRARFQVSADVVPPHAFLTKDSPVETRAYAAGVWSLRALTAPWPELLRSRFVLFDLPQVMESEPDFEIAPQKHLWVAIKKVLLTEVAPLWAPCFN